MADTAINYDELRTPPWVVPLREGRWSTDTTTTSSSTSVGQSDYQIILLTDALHQLDTAPDYAAVRTARERLLRLAPRVVDAAIDQMRRPQHPEHVSILEDLLVASLDPAEALDLGLYRAMAPVEEAAWVGLFAAYLKYHVGLSDVVRREMFGAIVKRSGSLDENVRLAAVEALGRLVGRIPEASAQLQSIAANDPSPIVAAGAEEALD